MTSARPSAAFTLVEVLVALTILGLITVSVSGGIRFAIRAWDVNTQQAAAAHEVVAVRRLLIRLVRKTVPPEPVRSRLTQGWTGDARGMSFAAHAPPALGHGTLRVRLHARKDGQLTLTWSTDRPPDTPGTPVRRASQPHKRSLLSGLQSARFRYFGQRGDDQPSWHHSWDAVDGLPSLVAIKLVFPAADPRGWPPLLVHPRAQLRAVPPVSDIIQGEPL